MARCSISGCERPTYVRGWCNRHYGRWSRNGHPLSGRIPHGERERYYREVVLRHTGDDCLIWPYTRNDHGYGKMRRQGREQIVSRLLCQDVNGPPPTGITYAAHSCGNGHLGCVNPKHVRWATPKENCEDKVIHGTAIRGQRIGVSKLTDEQAKQILAQKGKVVQTALARAYNIHQSTVSDIWTGRRWAWLEGR